MDKWYDIRDYQATYPDYAIDVLFACHGNELIEVGQKVLASPPPLHPLRTEQERDDDFGVWLAKRHGHVQKRVRIYTADQGQYADPSAYTFIAEFADEKLVSNYISYMRNKKRYSKKDIIVREVLSHKQPNGNEEITLGKVVGAISVLGEHLSV